MRRRPDWAEWLRGWDEQQEGFNPDRERRFSAMFDLLEASVGTRFRALDLGCGPGSLSARLLRRFPRARCVAVDYDPVVLQIGAGALGDQGGRLTWVDAKLGAPGWTERLPRGRFDAAVSTTALHWLQPPALRRLYRDLGGRLPRGGVFLDGDRMAADRRDRDFAKLAKRVRAVRHRSSETGTWWKEWERWWKRAERVPELRDAFAERARRHSEHPHHGDVPIGIHQRALRAGGFRQVEVVWQDLEDRILYAVR